MVYTARVYFGAVNSSEGKFDAKGNAFLVGG